MIKVLSLYILIIAKSKFMRFLFIIFLSIQVIGQEISWTNTYSLVPSGFATKTYSSPRTSDLNKIKIPTLMIGAEYDTMDPKAMKKMSEYVQNGENLHCPNGSHMSL